MLAPPQPAIHMQILAGVTHVGGIADAPTMTLKRMYHCVPRIMSGLSQMSGFKLPQHDAGHHDRKDEIRGKGRQELRDRLHDSGHPRPHAHIDADRHPDEARDRDQIPTRKSVRKPSNTTCRSPSPVTPRVHKLHQSSRWREHDQRDHAYRIPHRIAQAAAIVGIARRRMPLPPSAVSADPVRRPRCSDAAKARRTSRRTRERRIMVSTQDARGETCSCSSGTNRRWR
jgi:hypothetical protein